ncbi:hypothetical protein [Tsuneonella sp. HG222]
MNRRSFLHGSGTLALLGSLSAPAAGYPSIENGSAPLLTPTLIMVDARTHQAVDLATEWAHELEVPLAPFERDITAAWYQHLYGVWSSQSRIIGGVTSPSALFCIERLGWDARHRVIARSDLQTAAHGGELCRWLIAPQDIAGGRRA